MRVQTGPMLKRRLAQLTVDKFLKRTNHTKLCTAGLGLSGASYRGAAGSGGGVRLDETSA